MDFSKEQSQWRPPQGQVFPFQPGTFPIADFQPVQTNFKRDKPIQLFKHHLPFRA
jgi:hypothetical protein